MFRIGTILTLCTISQVEKGEDLMRISAHAAKRYIGKLTLCATIALSIFAAASTTEVYLDDFSDLASGWPSISSANYSWSYGASEYSLTIAARRLFSVSWAPLGIHRSGRVQIDCTAYKYAGAADTAYGIAWGVDDENYCVFWISSQGLYRVFFFSEGIWQASPIQWTEHRQIDRGAEENTLRVDVRADLATFSVNGSEILTIHHDFAGPYQAGLVGGTFDGSYAEIRFARFSVVSEATELSDEPVTAADDLESLPVETSSSSFDDTIGADDVYNAELAKSEASRILFSCNFAETDCAWSINANDARVWGHVEGALVLQVLAERWIAYSWAPLDELLPDEVSVSIVAHKREGSDSAEYGLIWGVDDDNYCSVTVSADGYYRVLSQKQGDWQTSLISWTQSAAINTQEGTNNLILQIVGTTATITINGYELATFEAPFAGPFKVGLVGGTFERADPPVEIRYEEFVIKTP